MASKNATVKNLLINEYGTCFLGGKVCKQNPYSYHHIVPVRQGGRTTFENGALLTLIQHCKFNKIEEYNKSIAEEINNGFRHFKETRDLQLVIQMRDFVNKKVAELGYQEEMKGKVLVLKRY